MPTGEPQHGAAYRAALAAREIAQLPQRGPKVQRRGQASARGEVVTLAVGPDKVQRRIAVEQIDDACAAEEVQKIRAAAHGHVRRQVDKLLDLCILIRAGAAARRGGLLEQLHAEAALYRRRGRGQTGHAAANNRHGRRFGCGGRRGCGRHVTPRGRASTSSPGKPSSIRSNESAWRRLRPAAGE